MISDVSSPKLTALELVQLQARATARPGEPFNVESDLVARVCQALADAWSDLAQLNDQAKGPTATERSLMNDIRAIATAVGVGDRHAVDAVELMDRLSDLTAAERERETLREAARTYLDAQDAEGATRSQFAIEAGGIGDALIGVREVDTRAARARLDALTRAPQPAGSAPRWRWPRFVCETYVSGCLVSVERVDNPSGSRYRGYCSDLVGSEAGPLRPTPEQAQQDAEAMAQSRNLRKSST